MQDYIKVWESIKLDRNLSFKDNAVKELQLYFGYSKDRIDYYLSNGEKILADEWNRKFKDNKITDHSIIEFYDKTESEIFELMNWHYNRYEDGPLQYVFAFEVAERNGFKSYLDYGSGIGTGGILFGLNNFKVTLADISSTNLKFCEYRFKQRKVNAELMDLKNQAFSGQKYDLITCFDVLEHAIDPIGILKKLRLLLNNGGMLIISTPFNEDEKRPMHIMTDKSITNRLRTLGYVYAWDLMQEYKKNTRREISVLLKASHNIISNTAYHIYYNSLLKIKMVISKIYNRLKR